MVLCYEQDIVCSWELFDAYEYQSGNLLDDMTDDFGDENVAKVADGVFVCREDELDNGDLVLVIVDTVKAGDVDVNALMSGWEWPID